MGLFRRSRALHEQLADDAGLDIGSRPGPSRLSGLAHAAGGGGFLMEPPDVFGRPSPLGEVGIHGIPRARQWDAIASADATLPGAEVHFVALPDGTLLVDEDIPDGSLLPLAAAIEESIEAPYRAVGVRQSESVWTVGATRVDVRELPGREGDELEEVEGDIVLLGRRLEGDLWEVEERRL